MDPYRNKNSEENNNEQPNNINQKMSNQYEEDDDDDINVFSDDENDFQKKNASSINNSKKNNDYSSKMNNLYQNQTNQTSYNKNSLEQISKKAASRGYLDNEDLENNENDNEFNYDMLNLNNNSNIAYANVQDNIKYKNKIDNSSNSIKFDYSQKKDSNLKVNLKLNTNSINKSKDLENDVNISDIKQAERSGLNISNNGLLAGSDLNQNLNAGDLMSEKSGFNKHQHIGSDKINFNPNTSLKRKEKDLGKINKDTHSNYKGENHSSNNQKSNKNLNQSNKAYNDKGKNHIENQFNNKDDYNSNLNKKEYLNTKGTKKTMRNQNNQNPNNEEENNNDSENNENEEIENENPNEIEQDEFLESLEINLRMQAEEIFDLFVNEISPKIMNPIAVDLFEMQNLLEVIGIRKNEFEINCALKKIKSEKLKSFKYEDIYTKENFIDVVESFLEFRIEDKLLVEVFRKIDLEENGVLNLVKLQEVSRKYQLNLSNEELIEILEFFNMESYLENKNSGQQYQNFKSTFDFEKFCKLYYQGG